MTFDEYVAARASALLRLAYVLTGDHHAAQDLSQSALSTALRHWRQVEAADHPDAYVRRILVTTHLSWRRRRWSGERPVADPPDRAVDDHAEAVADRDETRQLLGQLPKRARTVLVLRYYADLEDTAIADALGVSASTVRATASRALAELRAAQLRPSASAPGPVEGPR